MRYMAWVCDICGKPMNSIETNGTKIKLYKKGPLDFTYYKQDICAECYHNFIKWCREQSDKEEQEK